MKIQIASDLHLETFLRAKQRYSFTDIIPASAPFLILAGDIYNIGKGFFGDVHNYGGGLKFMQQFFDYLSKHWNQVLIIPGNHEYYRLDFKHEEESKWFKNFKWDIRDNVHMVNNQVFRLGDFNVACTTLWTDIPDNAREDIMAYMYDYSAIKNFTIDDSKKLHIKAIKFLVKSLKENDELIIATHHMPSWKLVEKKFERSLCSHAFANNLDDFMLKVQSQIPVWVYGHSHRFRDDIINGIKTIRNPLGYVTNKELSFYQKSFTISI